LIIDLLGWDADKAQEYLTTKGYTFVIDVSEPPNKQLNKGYLKVIKQELLEGIYHLTLTKVPDDYR
jgi:hypothetical protein